jgi:hypothetical protein
MEEIEDEDEEVLQLKIKTNQTPVAAFNLNSKIQSLKGKGQPLSTSQRRFFEPRFGCDFRGVRIHTDSKAAETAELVNAKAFTVGSDVAFNTSEYSSKSQSCQRLLAHELTHVVQQGKSSPPPDTNTLPFLNNSIMGPETGPGSSSLETENTKVVWDGLA